MAITRRQFVSTLGALAAAMGVGQADIAKLTEVFAHNVAYNGAGSWANKPKVIWVSGALCTGCTTSVLGLFEDVRGVAIEGTTTTTLAALDLAVGGDGSGATVLGPKGRTALGVTGTDTDVATHPFGHRTLWENGLDFDGAVNGTPFAANIADVLVDFIDLQYQETAMGPGGDLAYQWLKDNMDNGSANPFVMIVEGAVQPKSGGGAWGVTGAVPWCSIGMDGTQGLANAPELSFDDVVADLAADTNCKAVIAYGQCATYGGYPGAVSPARLSSGALEFAGSQTGAIGVKKFLTDLGNAGKDKVINVPGCPSNPWWLILTVVAWMVDFANAGHPLGVLTDTGINPAAVDKSGRLKAVFPSPIHGPACPRYQDFLNGNFATHPGQAGCLQLLGCKGPSSKGLCNVHGWNGLQPRNDSSWDSGLATVSGRKGSACPMAGHPCMGCTEVGYPDAFVPFVAR